MPGEDAWTISYSWVVLLRLSQVDLSQTLSSAWCWWRANLVASHTVRRTLDTCAWAPPNLVSKLLWFIAFFFVFFCCDESYCYWLRTLRLAKAALGVRVEWPWDALSIRAFKISLINMKSCTTITEFWNCTSTKTKFSMIIHMSVLVFIYNVGCKVVKVCEQSIYLLI